MVSPQTSSPVSAGTQDESFLRSARKAYQHDVSHLGGILFPEGYAVFPAADEGQHAAPEGGERHFPALIQQQACFFQQHLVGQYALIH